MHYLIKNPWFTEVMVLDQGSLTQLMILVKLFDHVEKPGSIAKDIGITIQGVSYHLKLLKKRGLLSENNELTKEGFSFMESGLSSLRDFVSENLTKIDNIVTWEAIADESISQGDEVRIYMKKGYLHANLTGDNPTGISKNSASRGEVVAVTSISDIINVKLGTIEIFVLPPIEGIDDRPSLLEQLQSSIRNDQLVGVSGEQAYVLLGELGIAPDLEFASIDGVFEAATRGMSSALVISSRRFHYMLSDLKELENRFKEISVRIKYL